MGCARFGLSPAFRRKEGNGNAPIVPGERCGPAARDQDHGNFWVVPRRGHVHVCLYMFAAGEGCRDRHSWASIRGAWRHFEFAESLRDPRYSRRDESAASVLQVVVDRSFRVLARLSSRELGGRGCASIANKRI